MFEMMCPSAQHNEATLLPVIGYAKSGAKVLLFSLSSKFLAEKHFPVYRLRALLMNMAKMIGVKAINITKTIKGMPQPAVG